MPKSAEKFPLISVLMSVYNAQHDLKGSIDSILAQSFTDFEFIIINDGSTDESGSILDTYAAQDPRIKIIHQDNTGLTKALNNGIEHVRGVYIARQDADDISYPDRLQLQFDMMQADHTIVLSGGNCDDIYPDGTKGEWGVHSRESLQDVPFIKTPFAHSTAMMRSDICRELGGYDARFKTSQDMEFWMRFAKAGDLAMIEHPILLRRIVEGSISKKRRGRQFRDAMHARWLHNQGIRRVRALYCGLRSLIISLLPPGFIRVLKGYLRS